jgi:WD repeat-containing protein 35
VLALNCDATRLSVIDINGILSLVDLRADGGRGEHLPMERKDAWGMQWSSDNPQVS